MSGHTDYPRCTHSPISTTSKLQNTTGFLNQNIAKKLNEFYLFSQFPIEVREMIWESYKEEPRLVTITCGYKNLMPQKVIPDPVEKPLEPVDLLTARYTGTPVLFSVNSESRRVAMCSHKLVWACREIFLNPDLDVFHFRGWRAYKFFSKSIDSSIDSLGKDVLTTDYFQQKLRHIDFLHYVNGEINLGEMLRFKNLETLTVNEVSDEGTIKISGNGDFVSLEEAKVAWKTLTSEAQKTEEGRGFAQFVLERDTIHGNNFKAKYWLHHCEKCPEGGWSWKHEPQQDEEDAGGR